MLEDDPLTDPKDDYLTDPDNLGDLGELGDLGDLGDPDNLGDIPVTLIELEKIPRRLWEQTLVPLHRQQRMWVALQVSDERLRDVATNLAFELDMAECGRRKARDEARFEARRTGAPLPAPHADHAVTRSTVQVNLRLRRDDHARLTQAAAAVGLKPTTLARALVLNGATKILQDHGRTPGYP